MKGSLSQSIENFNIVATCSAHIIVTFQLIMINKYYITLGLVIPRVNNSGEESIQHSVGFPKISLSNSK